MRFKGIPKPQDRCCICCSKSTEKGKRRKSGVNFWPYAAESELSAIFDSFVRDTCPTPVNKSRHPIENIGFAEKIHKSSEEEKRLNGSCVKKGCQIKVRWRSSKQTWGAGKQKKQSNPRQTVSIMAGFVSLFLNHSREKLPNGGWKESLRLWRAQPTKSDPKFARIIIIVATTLVSRLSARGTTRFYIVCDTWHLEERGGERGS